jgi:alanine racemase
MPSLQTRVDLARIRSNAEAILKTTGVELIAVLKADGYGHGAVSVADAINDLASGWYVFTCQEAVEARLFDLTGKHSMAGNVPLSSDVEMMADNGIRPGVWQPEGAQLFARLDPILCVDTGMQRFACPPEQIDAMFAAHAFNEAYTHASRPEQVAKLRELMTGHPGVRLHAAATALMDRPDCRLDAVRPGLALYEGAARVSATLLEARDQRGPIGYTGFSSPTHRHGVILAGYSNGLRAGPVRVNGRPQRILEIGMQSAYVSLDANDKVGDEVVLLGDDLSLTEVAAAWGTGPQQAMVTLVGMGEKHYV